MIRSAIEKDLPQINKPGRLMMLCNSMKRKVSAFSADSLNAICKCLVEEPSRTKGATTVLFIRALDIGWNQVYHKTEKDNFENVRL